ncbi:MAG: FAD-dependent oxidoreductase [Pseudomonadota bacterium]
MIDFLVIGGGIAGVSAAARLADLGSVTLLEAEPALAYHASGRSAALYEQNYGKPATISLNKISADFHRDAGVLSPRGLLLVGTVDQADHFAADSAEMKLNPISVDEACKMLPVLDPAVVDRAAYDADAWDIDTDRLVQTFARHLKQRGGQSVTSAPVSDIQRDTTGWTVIAAGTAYHARNIVNAAGAWVDKIAEMAGVTPLGFTPLRRSMAVVPAPTGTDISAWPMLFGPGEDWYAKPAGGALLVSPADEDPAPPHDAYADELTLAQGIAKFEAHTTMQVTRLQSSWAGLRTFAPDRTLVLGPDIAEPSFIWCAGQGGYGMQSAPGASQLLADLVAGRQPPVDAKTVAALAPARFQ